MNPANHRAASAAIRNGLAARLRVFRQNFQLSALVFRETKFNSSGRQCLPDRGATWEACRRLAKSKFERKAADYAHDLFGFGFLEGYPEEDLWREFMFRCVFIPWFCIEVIKCTLKCTPSPYLWVWEHATHLIAYERLCWEIQVSGHATVLGPLRLRRRKAQGSPVPISWAVPHPSRAFHQLEGTRLEYWTSRFEAWRDAAQSSFIHYHSQYCSNPSKVDAATRKAALAGYLQNISPLPPSLFAALQSQIGGSLPDSLTLLAKNWADPQPTKYGAANRPPSPPWLSLLALDTWLIEIWPLVTVERWRKPDIVQVAGVKTPTSKDNLSSVEQCTTRCKKLHLSVAASGGPSILSPDTARVTPTAQLGAHIRCIGEDPVKWLRGQSGLV